MIYLFVNGLFPKIPPNWNFSHSAAENLSRACSSLVVHYLNPNMEFALPFVRATTHPMTGKIKQSFTFQFENIRAGE